MPNPRPGLVFFVTNAPSIFGPQTEQGVIGGIYLAVRIP